MVCLQSRKEGRDLYSGKSSEVRKFRSRWAGKKKKKNLANNRYTQLQIVLILACMQKDVCAPDKLLKNEYIL